MFLIQASRDPSDDFWYGPVGQSLAGEKVTIDTSLKLAAFYSCCVVKAQTLAQLPLNLYQRLERGREKATANELWSLLHSRPNRYQSSYQWREMGSMHLDLRGNFYNRIVYDGRGRVVELIPIHPDHVVVERIDDVSHRYKVKNREGDMRTFTMDEILHIAGPTIDGPVGLNPIELHRETIGKAIATREYGSQFYRNGATMPGWIEYPAKLDQETRRKLGDSWQKAQTGKNRFKTPVLDRGMIYHELSIKHTDLQYLESLKDEDVVISQIMRVPPYKIYRMDHAKYSNVEQMEIDFVRNTMIPIATRWEQTLDHQLLDSEERTTFYFKFKMDGLLRGDTQTRGDYYAKALGSGGHEPFMTVNEIRELEEMNPIDGGDELPRVDNSQRLEAMLQASAQRCVNRLTFQAERAKLAESENLSEQTPAFFADHAKWVAEAMQIPVSAAEEYCVELELELLASTDPAATIANWKERGASRLMEIAR